MKFKVSEKVKGSLILKSLGRAVSTGTTVYVEGDSLYANDIQMAIKAGLLTPSTPEEKIEVREKIINKTNEAVIVNKTDRVVIIGNFPIRPNGSAIKDLSKLDMNVLRKCIENGLIQVITDVDEEMSNDKFPTTNKVKTEKIEQAEQIELESGIEILEETDASAPQSPEDELAQLIEESDRGGYDGEEVSEDREDGSKCVVWDFRKQENKKPKVVPKTVQKMITEEEPDVKMIDALDEANDVEEDKEIKLINDKIESMKKKLAQKKAYKKKSSKKKDNKAVKTKFTRESEENIAPSLDSRGNPLVNDMTHMVDATNGDEISFCDQEQAQKNIENAKKQGNSINLDLD